MFLWSLPLGSTRSITTLWRRAPVPSSFSFWRLRTNNPAPTSSTRESASCAIARMRPGRKVRVTALRTFFNAGARSIRVARHAGASPNRRPVTIDTAAVNPRIRRLGLRSNAIGVRPDDMYTTRS